VDMPQLRDVAVTNLLLDVTNPRFETEQENQRDAIRTLAEEQGEKLLNLAEDIVKFNLDPSSLVIVIPAGKDNRRYIAVEGNRRIAALRLLQNPDLARGVWQARNERRLKALSEKFKAAPIKQVPCVELPDREAASHWIQLRHRGEQQGRGIVAWDGLAAARYEERLGGGRARATLQAIDFVRKGGRLDPATLDRLGEVPITTVQRLLNDPDVRTALGVEIENGQLTTQLPEKEVLKGLTRIIRDAARGDLPVSRVETKQHRAEYLKSFATTDLPSASAPRGESRPVTTGEGLPLLPRQRKRIPPSRKRVVLIPRTCALVIPEAKPNDIYHELRRLRLDDFPYAVGVLFRVFLELSVDHYISERKLMDRAALDTAKLRLKLNRVADHLEQSGAMTKRGVRVLRLIANPQHLLAGSIDTLHSYVHDAHFAAGPSDLKAAWNSLEPFFKKMWE
jgi:hypothetical protein